MQFFLCDHFVFNLTSYCEYTEFSLVDNLHTFKCYKKTIFIKSVNKKKKINSTPKLCRENILSVFPRWLMLTNKYYDIFLICGQVRNIAYFFRNKSFKTNQLYINLYVESNKFRNSNLKLNILWKLWISKQINFFVSRRYWFVISLMYISTCVN